MPDFAKRPPEQQRIVACPQCGEDSIYAASNPYRPFCSQRCKLIDLGAWSNEDYSIAQRPDASEDPDIPPTIPA